MTGDTCLTHETENGTWEELAKRTAAGDSEAEKQLLLETYTWLMAAVGYFLRKRGFRADLVDDIVQEVQLALITQDSWSRFPSVEAWLKTVYRRTVVRVHERNPTHLSLTSTSADGEEIFTYEPVDKSRSPEELAIREESRAEVRAGLAELSEQKREALTLTVIEGLEYAEAAEIVGVPKPTLHSRRNQAVKDLREKLLRGENRRDVRPPEMPAR
jgi:RNA polymerase sigma-70 factor (ECF subfamily)